eukprot:5285223-Pyramimonas_sp.AAC.1
MSLTSTLSPLTSTWVAILAPTHSPTGGFLVPTGGEAAHNTPGTHHLALGPKALKPQSPKALKRIRKSVAKRSSSFEAREDTADVKGSRMDAKGNIVDVKGDNVDVKEGCSLTRPPGRPGS